jgi:hypothetical protein
VTAADCGCPEPTDTYYAEVDGCCQEGSFPKNSTQCWEGSPGTESARINAYRCCTGQCEPVVVGPQGGCLEPGDRECPGGCCPNSTWVCCPDGFNCSPCLEDCPPWEGNPLP